jgi:mRNA deadenylase 3'-5' endonuclease subunit Ccr4
MEYSKNMNQDCLPSESNLQIKIISYNILAQRYLDPNIPTIYKDSDYLKWDHRKKSIINQIISYDPDIICLQEVELANFDSDFIELFKTYAFVRHIVNKKRTSPIGNVTLYKNNIENIKLINKSSALINIFKIKDNEFCLANLHLKAGYQSGEKTRESQLKSILGSCINNLVIICGDFNDDLEEYESQPNSDKVTATKRLLLPLLLKENLLVNQKQITCCVNGNYWWSFDHVASKGLKVDIQKCDKVKQIPSKYHPSDHLPIKFLVTI